MHKKNNKGRLRQWFDSGGAANGLQSLSAGGGGSGGEARPPVPFAERATIQGLTDAGLGKNGVQEYCEIDVSYILNDKT